MRPEHVERERLGRALVEVRDDEVVDRESEREQRRGEDAWGEQRQSDRAERREGVGAQIAGGLLEAAVESDQPRTDDDNDEADREHDVGDQQAREPEGNRIDQEHRQQRGTEDDLRGRHRQHDQQVRRAAAREAMADQRDRHQGPDRRRRCRRERRELEGGEQRLVQVREREGALPVLEREAVVDREGEPVSVRGCLSEREDGDHGDRDEHVRNREPGVDIERVPPQPRPSPRGRARVGRSRRRRGGLHRYRCSSSLPTNASVPASRM